ncbi:MAG: phosphatidylserine/phosphatidylglycerophosphate/cardiolipin synthase family protein, partial [Nitrospirae bacterium]|nr:phosphatidylserine/phosphatidylglycerophosphate/cardiolipin synthase family protein [Nitrospirota bacterium]
MENIRILKSPWRSDFIRLIKESRKSIQLASPYIKKSVSSLIVEHANSSVNIDYLNSFKLSNFYRGASDLEALEILHKRDATIKSYHQLHAKVFIFDKRKSVVTSGNLTSGGLLNNYEYGLLINDEELTAKIAEDYRKVFKDTEATGIITAEIISKAYNILQSVPKEKKPKFELKDKDLFKKVTEEDIEVDRYEGGIESIQNNLSGWVKDVFTVLNEIDSDVFRL